MLEMLLAAHDAGPLPFFATDAHLADAAAFKPIRNRWHRLSGSSYSKRRSPVRRKVGWSYLPYTHRVAISNRPPHRQPTRTASRSAIPGYRMRDPAQLHDHDAQAGRIHQAVFLIHVLPNGIPLDKALRSVLHAHH